MRRYPPNRRGRKVAVSCEQLARFAHPYRIGDSTGKQPRRWESITKAANKRFRTDFLPAHIKRCYAKHRDELSSRTSKKIIREARVTENLERRLAENDKKKDLLHRENKEPDLNVRRQRDLEEYKERLRVAEERAEILRREDRRKYNRRFRKKKKIKSKSPEKKRI